jgi:hypothetical protein
VILPVSFAPLAVTSAAVTRLGIDVVADRTDRAGTDPN